MHSQPRHLNEVYSIFDEAMLGKGSTGNVYLGCVNGNPAQKVAIKSINLHQINNQVTRYLLSCEIAALRNLGKLQNTQHDNIIRLHQIIILDNYIYLVTELLQGGTLADYISKHPNGLPQEEAMMILRQVLEGYKYIKDKHIVHRDLKPDNILFKADPTQNKKVAIIDFGYCEMREVPNKPKMFYNVGSPKYMSPEAYKQNKYSQKSDIWAIGVILYQMLIGKTCDHGMTMQSYLEMIQKKGVPLPHKLRNFHKHLLSLMLAYNHQARIQCDQILKALNLHQDSQEITHQIHLRHKLPNQPNQHLRASFDINPSQRPQRNNPVFQSAFLPSQVPQNTNHHSQQPFQMMRLPRSQLRLSEPDQNNTREQQEKLREAGVSFTNQDSSKKRVYIQQKPIKAANVDFNSVKQFISRRNPNNNVIQIKPTCISTFAKQIHFVQPSPIAQNGAQQLLHLQRPAMNQIVNQSNNKISILPQNKSNNIIATPKQNINFNKSNQPSRLPETHISHFQIPREPEIENFKQNLHLKNQALGMHNFNPQNQNRRQSDYYLPPQSKFHVIQINQPQLNHDLTHTRHPYPDLVQRLRPQQDLTQTRVSQYEIQYPGMQNHDLTQIKLPGHLISNDFKVNKAPRGLREVELLQKTTVTQQAQTSQGFNQRKDFISDKVPTHKVPSKPFQTVREVVNLRPQVTSIRNSDNKMNYVRLNSQNQVSQQPHFMLLRPSTVK